MINCKIELLIDWYENCILSSAETGANFAISDTKSYVLVVTLKTEDNGKLLKLLREGLKRSIYWNEYDASLKNYRENGDTRERLDASIQGLTDCLFLLIQVVIILLMKIHIEDIFV